MNFLKRIFSSTAASNTSGRKEPSLATTSLLQAPNTFQGLLEKYAGLAFEKQLALTDVIGDLDFSVSVRDEIISFSERLVFPMQILGTISHSSQSWLWAWANTQSNLPESILEHSLALKAYGEKHGIDLLTDDKFPFDKEEMHKLGLIASGMFNSTGYYIADYGSGAMLVTLSNNKVVKQNPSAQQAVLMTFPQLISQIELNHKATLKNYLLAKGFTVNTPSANSLSASSGREQLKAEFDAQGRLTKMTN